MLKKRHLFGRHFALMARLALRDYRHEWVMSGCSVLALAAVLIPLLVLFGLKFGIITNLLNPLIENPRYREITPSTSGHYEPQWFDEMRARPDVAFVVPRTRTLAASMKLRVPASRIGRIVDVELIPSSAGDPALGPDQTAPAGYRRVLLSASAAEKLGAKAGTPLEGILTRTRNGKQETVRLLFQLAGVTRPSAFARDGLFVSGDLLVAVEDFLDGRAVPALGWAGTTPPGKQRAYAGFRMYARSIDDVAALRAVLQRQGIDVRTSAADIDLVKTLNRNLSVVYWIIALITVGGYCLSFATSVWANVGRKRREFSVLRLTGFRTGGIVWFPVLQAGLTGALAWALACIGYLIVQATLNSLFSSSIGGGHPVCRLLPWHLLLTLALTVLAAGAAATAGGRRVAQQEPSLGLRDG